MNGTSFEPFSTFERQKSVFREHPWAGYEQVELTAKSELELKTGSIITIKNGVAALATNDISVDDDIAVVFGNVVLNAEEKTSVAIVHHCECVKDQMTIAEGADIDAVAKVCAKKGLYIR